ncbi:hypothetical protein [Prevotella dentasini]|uniref:hypothetical protein n=1 Tax=Prevotella dentasini TaxID=589537 RepID=UPI0004696EC6|nr:hypothetical protein [Prevotella dentasini]
MRTKSILQMAAMAAASMTLTSCSTLLALDGSTGTVVGTDAVYTSGYDAGYDYAYGRMAYDDARRKAFYLSDKMAYELGLTDSQFEAVYEINLDYLLSMQGEASIYSNYWQRRNSDLFYVLTPAQYNYFVGYDYFYRPVYWYDNSYVFAVYDRYSDPQLYYRRRPVYYDSYRGGRNQMADSYYRGRFGQRTGQPVVSNRNTGSGTFAGRRTPSDNAMRNRTFGNGSKGGNRNFGNGTRNGNNGNGNQNSNKNGNSGNRTFGNGTRNSNSYGNISRSNGSTNAYSSGNGNGRTTSGRRPANPNRNSQTITLPSHTNTPAGSFGGSRQPTATPRQTSPATSPTTRQTTPSRQTSPATVRQTPAPRQAPSAPRNNGSFGGHR